MRLNPTKHRNLLLLALAAAFHDADRALRGNDVTALLLRGELERVARFLRRATR